MGNAFPITGTLVLVVRTQLATTHGRARGAWRAARRRMRQPLVVLAVITGCASPIRLAEPPPDPPPTEVQFEVEVPPPVVIHQGSGEVSQPTRDQPPEVKLRLGHYSNAARGIGVTIDRTSELSPGAFRVAKLRYDGDPEIRVLDAQVGSNGRTDYVARRQVVLHVYDGGRIEIYVGNEGPIALSRDGDADPL